MANQRDNRAASYMVLPVLKKKKEESNLVPVLKTEKPSITAQVPVLKTAKTNLVKTPKSDADIIKEYESIPNRNILERSFSRTKDREYKNKQKLYKDYRAAKNRQTLDFLKEYKPAEGNKNVVDMYKQAEKSGVGALNLLDFTADAGTRLATKDVTDFADEHGITATGLSFLTNFGKTASLGADLGNYIIGRPIGYNEAANNVGAITGKIRDTVSDNIQNPIGKFAYGVGTSMGDSLIAAGLSAVSGGVAGPVLMGTNAAGDTLNHAREKNVSPDKMMGTAVAAGAIETLTEKIPLDNLLKVAKGMPKQTASSVIKNVLKQAGTEGAEETISELANTLADYAINGEESDWSKDIQNYMAHGMTKEQATKQAYIDLGQRAAYAGAAGAVSGGIMGGGAEVVGHFRNRVPTLTDSTVNNNVEYDNSVNATQNNAQEPAVNLQPLPNANPNTENGGQSAPTVTTDTGADGSGLNPLQGSGAQRVRSYNETLVNKTDMDQSVKNEFIGKPDMYNQLTNKETAERANSILENNSIDSAVSQCYGMILKKDPAAVPLAFNLAKQLVNNGQVDEAVQLERSVSRAMTEAGQFSQAAVITMLDNNPQAVLTDIMNNVDEINTKGREKFGKKWKDFRITEAEQQQFAQIENGDKAAIEAASQKIYDRIRRQYPTTTLEKLMEARRIAMLLNIRTNVKNIGSNAMLMPVRWTSDRVTALGEGVYSLINPNYERTQSLNPFRSKRSKQLAAEVYESVKTDLLGDSKYNDVSDAIRDRQMFKGSKLSQMIDNATGGAITKANEAMGKVNDPSLMETARNFTYWLLEEGDNVFVKKNFESRLASYLDAQHITDIDQVPPEAITLATQEAYKATFKDDTMLANMLSGIRRNLNKIGPNGNGPIGDLIMPFTKTPANLAMRGIDYSPAGMINAIGKLSRAKNHTEVASAMTLLGQSVTGTAAIAAGYALAQSGVISGALSDDKDEAAFQRRQGMLPYAIKVGNNYYTYDWAQPTSIPLILGATIYQAQQDSDTALNAALQGAMAATDSWLELSPLQNLSDILGGNGSFAENLTNNFAQAPLSWIPAQLKAVTRVGDTTQRQMWTNTGILDNVKNQFMASIPGLSEKLLAKYDTWGNEVKRQDSTGEAFFANFLNPGQLGNASETPIDGEISRLFNATGNNDVFPKQAPWTYRGGGESTKLSNEQYSEYQRIMGSNAYDMASAFINSKTYSSIPDDKKVDVLSDMYNFADALAKRELFGYDVENSNTYKKLYSVYQEKGTDGVVGYLSIKANMDGNSSSDKIAAISGTDMSDADKGYYLKQFIDPSKTATEIENIFGSEGLYKWYSMRANADTDGNGSISNTEMAAQIAQSGMSYDDMVAYAEPMYEDGKKTTAREKAEKAIQEASGNSVYSNNLQKIQQMLGQNTSSGRGQSYDELLERVESILQKGKTQAPKQSYEETLAKVQAILNKR